MQLPNIRADHLKLVLDYLYTGEMYLTAEHLAGVLRVMEVLRMKCGVSVSKMVPNKKFDGKRDDTDETKPMWVEEAKFGGLQHLALKQVWWA